MTMTCGRITNYASCVAREPLWRTITVRNQNTSQARYGTRPFVVLLSSDEQSGADEASKFCQSVPHSSKSDSRSVLSYMPLRLSCGTNFISNTVNYDTEILKAGFHMIADDRGSQTIAKSACHENSYYLCFPYCFCFFACRYLIVSFHYLKFVRSIVNYL